MKDALQSVLQTSGSSSGQIDHIPLSDGLTALDVKIDSYSKGKFPSDHFPVIAKISMAPRMQPIAANTRIAKRIQNYSASAD